MFYLDLSTKISINNNFLTPSLGLFDRTAHFSILKDDSYNNITYNENNIYLTEV